MTGRRLLLIAAHAALLLGVLLAALLLHTYREGAVTPANFQRVEEGMPPQRVEHLFGGPGHVVPVHRKGSYRLAYMPDAESPAGAWIEGTDPDWLDPAITWYSWRDGRHCFIVAFKDGAVLERHNMTPYRPGILERIRWAIGW